MTENKQLFNLEAEQAVLGALLVDCDLLDLIGSNLKSDYFYDPVHALIFDYIKNQVANNKKIDAVTAYNWFKTNNSLQTIGGGDYISLLVNAACFENVIDDYSQLIKENWQKRKAIDSCNNLTQSIFKEIERPIDELIGEHETAISDFMIDGENIEAEISAGALAAQYIQDLENNNIGRIGTGFITLDNIIGRLSDGHLCTIGGRPSMGKTAFVTSIALNNTRAGMGCLFISMDSANDQLMARLISNHSLSKYKYSEIRADNFDDFMKQDFKQAQEEIAKLPLYISDKRGRSVDDIMSFLRKVRKQVAKKGHSIDFIIIDHLHKIAAPPNLTNEYSQVTYNIRRLKNALMSNKVACFLCCQLSNALENRPDKRPRMSDFRDSGGIAEESDVMLGMYRHAYYIDAMMREEKDPEKWDILERESVENAKVLEIGIIKNRQGSRESLKLFCDISRNIVADMGV